jgi:uncharacterized protein (DUF305 family)
MGSGLLRCLTLLAALSGGQGAPAQEAHDHGHMHARPDAPAVSGPVLYTTEDLAFLHHMIVHHQQALDMAALMDGRTERADFLRFAGYVADAQRAEIQAMQGMLDMAQARGLPTPMLMAHGDPPMAGMLSSAEMKALEAARGAAFERQWLQGMVFHHEGGLAMARVQELRQAQEGRQPYGIATMLDDILVNQRAEITRMRGWLQAWGLATPGDARAPAVEVVSAAAVPVGRPATLMGVAVDDQGVAAVEVTVHDLSSDRRQSGAAERIGSGPASAAWRFVFTPPSRGRYEVRVEAVDLAGKRASAAESWTVEAR